MTVTPDQFRTLLRRHASGVVVVTAMGDRPCGFTATSFVSVSLNPPLVLFCVGVSSSVSATMAVAADVGVNLLAEDQEPIARIFATPGVDRFVAPTRWTLGPAGVPILHGTAATLVCQVVDRMRAGDHIIVLAEVVSGRCPDRGEHPPLLYHMGDYARLCDPLRQPALSGQQAAG